MDRFVKNVVNNLNKITKNHEIILIDDNSTDNSWKTLADLCSNYKNLIIKKNKTNIGQHPTIRKGLKISTGDLIFILDCDLQDNPKYFKKFLKNYLLYNCAIVGLMNNISFKKKRSISKVFWKILNLLSKIEFPPNITNFTLISSDQSKIIFKLKKVGFLYGDICRSNISVKFIRIKRYKRFNGLSSYTFLKIFKLALIWLYIYS